MARQVSLLIESQDPPSQPAKPSSLLREVPTYSVLSKNRRHWGKEKLPITGSFA